MGAIMQTSNTRTIADICQGNPALIATVQKYMLRNFPDIPRKKAAPLSEGEVAAVMSAPALRGDSAPILPKIRVVKSRTAAAPKEEVVAPVQATENTPEVRSLADIALQTLLCGIVVIHALLIWYDCVAQWDTPGLIGGCLAFCIVLAALLLSADKTRVRTSDTALWFVALVDALAVFVHYPTFLENAKIGELQTGVLSVFLASVSWTALYLFRDYKID